jgi:hypothetical protein
MIPNAEELLLELRQIHERIRDAVVKACEECSLEELSSVSEHEEGGDTIFAIDRISERVLIELFAKLASRRSMVLVAEGLANGGQVVLPEGTSASQAELRVIIDPIDGTRGLMYQKRPAWILTGVAPNRGEATTLADIELALQTEIPILKQHLCDTLWARAGAGAHGERLDRVRNRRTALVLRPSRASTLEQGFGGLARFFPGPRAELAAIDDQVIERLLGPIRPGRALAFEDQYISTGGQLYELMAGHDRWIADLRPLVEPLLRARGLALGLCCHPYDLCSELVAREAGVVVGDALGRPLAYPLDVTTDCAWAGYANRALFERVQPVLEGVLRERHLVGA